MMGSSTTGLQSTVVHPAGAGDIGVGGSRLVGVAMARVIKATKVKMKDFILKSGLDWQV